MEGSLIVHAVFPGDHAKADLDVFFKLPFHMTKSNLIMPYLISVILSLLLAGICSASRAQDVCLQQARNSYEKLYCEVKAGGEGADLPSLADFRRNPPKIQALLLRRPASRLGLELPQQEAQQKILQSKISQQQLPQPQLPRQELQPQASQGKAVPKPADRESVEIGLTACELHRDIIRCGEHIFQLALNRANHQLRAQALSKSNHLSLPTVSGSGLDEKNDLIQAYQIYIEKMLEIGLGASTMTFSKFYYTYQTLQRQDVDFAQRMEKMFGFLKKDKATMAVQKRYHNTLPDSMEQCGHLSERLVVCDEGDMNWVFLRQPQATKN